MEVHHHPDLHHKKKKWKEYFLEFLMIFLAVTMGFFSEGLREHQVEKSREKEFMESMLNELKSDSKDIKIILNDTVRCSKLDTLAILILSQDYSPRKIQKIYQLNNRYAMSYNGMEFNRSTLTQLKNAGNMRLIRKRNIVDSLIALDNKISTVNTQLTSAANFLMQNVSINSSIFNQSYFIKDFKFIPSSEDLGSNVNLKFLTNDRTVLLKYGSIMRYQSRIFRTYMYMLQDVEECQSRLIPLIEKEYNLE